MIWNVREDNMDLSLQDRILSQRNIENLTMDWNQDLHDPFLMKDMEKGVGKFVSHLQEGQKIMIVGDYDVDGITASALFHDLFLFLDKTEQMIARLPHRVEDGYGLSKKFIDEAVQQGCSLIVTVDNGISAYDEVVYANEKGIEVVITDHHMVPAQIPPAYATINPHQSDCQYPFSDLSGVAVAYKFCQAVLVALGIEENKRDYWLRWKSSLVALGTVADCMVLTGENRSLTHFGIKAINAGASVGISSLVKSAQGKYIKPVDAQGIGFGLAPRINAAGRLYNPNTAYDLLVASDKMQADVLAEQLHEMNAQRQLAVHVAMKEVEEMIDAEKSTLIVAASEKWSKGIVGLIAGRLSEKYNKPAIIFHDSQDGFLTASCRSIESYDIASALSVFEHLLAHYGGHAQAAGLSVSRENYQQFVESIKSYTEDQLAGKDLEKTLKIDTFLTLEDMHMKTIEMIDSLQPFGMGNPEPVFACMELRLDEVHVMGKEKEHMRFKFSWDNKQYSAVYWRSAEKWEDKLHPGMIVDIAGRLEKNEWNGKITLQLQIVDIHV